MSSALVSAATRGATAELGAWTAGLRFERLPSEVVEHAKLCLLDGLGCGLFGAQQPWGKISARVAHELSGSGPSTLWASAWRSSPSDAALANGTALHGFEIDDVHVKGLIHPASVTLPAIVALAESRPTSGPALLTALVAGYEVSLRVGIAAGLPHGSRGYHPNGTVGCLGSAAGAANLLQLDARQSMHALGIGATQAAGLYSARMGAMSKRMHAGRAAQSGVLAALLAEQGFTGAEDALEAPWGGFMSTLSDGQNLDLLVDGLGERWETTLVGFKAYAACASAHTTIDALDKLMRRGLRADNLAHLRIRMTTVGATNVGWPYRPNGIVSAQMNGFYAASVKLLDGDAFIDQYTEDRLADPAILSLMEKIEITPDPELDAAGVGSRHAVRVLAESTDGQVWEEYVEQRRGSFDHPLSQEELERKFARTAGASLKPEAVDELRELVLSIEQAETLERLGALLSAPR
jgi:2-methylcitrate dehydratase PrpD